jgi:arginine deiminase
MDAGVKAEFHKATDVILHEPGIEMFYGCMMPSTNGYLGPFDRHQAIKEHRRFADELRNHGVRVHLLKDMMLSDTVDDEGMPADGKNLDRLREMASGCLKYRCRTHVMAGRQETFQLEKDDVILKNSPEDLASLILLRPDFLISYGTSGFISEPGCEPQGNICYTRDQMITTDRGIVLGRMAHNFRRHETDIVRFALGQVGIKPVYEVQGPQSLEGGDFIPAGDFALIGQGCRTSKGAIDQLLENRVFGYKQVAVVEDTMLDNNQMHLDTYFNIVGDRKAIILDTRRKDHRPKIRVYSKMRDDGYCYDSRAGGDLIEFLEGKGYSVKDIEYNKDKNFSVNVLCIGDRKVIGVNGIAKEFYREMLDDGIEAKMLDFPNLIMAYGGPHCLSQVIRREP